MPGLECQRPLDTQLSVLGRQVRKALDVRRPQAYPADPSSLLSDALKRSARGVFAPFAFSVRFQQRSIIAPPKVDDCGDCRPVNR
jgi:hypothetical protein